MKYAIARASDIPDGGRLLVNIRGLSIGIFNIGGDFCALRNRCPHMGGPLCKGSLLGRLEAQAPGELHYDASQLLLQCPWHGWEYDLRTGQSYFNSRARSYPVEVEHGDLVSREMEQGEVVVKQPDPGGESTPHVVTGLSGPCLQAGPYVAETYEISVEDDYLVVIVPGRARK